MPPAAKSLAIQLCAVLVTLGGVALRPLPALGFALLAGGVACVLSMLARQPRWWWALHLLFLPAVVLAQAANIAPGWFLAAFVVLMLFYWNSARAQVPLYLSNATTAQAVCALLPATPGVTLIDAGCGTGSLITRVARARADCPVIGLENAPLPWLLAWLRSLAIDNCQTRFGDLWAQRFDEAQVVYAFLSPVPMQRLWQKCCAEMQPGGMLVSNSFEVPGVVAEEVIELTDRRGTRLFCYRV
jgi:precorrin-6B methylase 2